MISSNKWGMILGLEMEPLSTFSKTGSEEGGDKESPRWERKKVKIAVENESWKKWKFSLKMNFKPCWVKVSEGGKQNCFQDDSLASGFACSCSQVTEKELSHNSNNFSGHWGGNFCISLLKSKMWGKSWAEISSRLHFHVLWIWKLIEIKNENHLFLQVRFSWSCPIFEGGAIAIFQPARYGHIYNSPNSEVLFCSILHLTVWNI